MNVKRPMERGSPNWVILVMELRRRRLEDRLEALLTKYPPLFPVLLGTCLGSIVAVILSFAESSSAKFDLRTAALLGPFLLFFIGRMFWRSVPVALTCLGPFVGLIILLEVGHFSVTQVLWGSLTVIALLAIGLALYRAQCRFRIKSDGALLICFLIAVAVLNLSFWLAPASSHLLDLATLRPLRWVIGIGYPLFELAIVPAPKPNWRLFLNYLGFPYLISLPVPSRLENWRGQPTRQLESKGLIDLAFVLWALIMFALSFIGLRTIRIENPIVNYLVSGTMAYLLYYFYSAGTYTLPVALGRMMGHDLEVAFDYPLFASSPQERWRRWNTYFFHFFRSAIFHPVMKRTGSLLLSVAAVFYLMALVHVSVDQLPFVYIAHETFHRQFDDWTLYGLLHGFTVYVGLKTHRWWAPMDSRKAWWGVLLTWLAMIQIHRLNTIF
jgi:hypothetical protein